MNLEPIAAEIRKSIRLILAKNPDLTFNQMMSLFQYTNPEILKNDALSALSKEILEHEKNILKDKISSNL